MSKLTTVRRVANNSLQAELIDVVTKPGQMNVLAKLNKGDDRFKVGSERRAWFPVTLASLIDLGASEHQVAAVEALKEGEKAELMLDAPKIEGKELRIQVVESTTPDSYQAVNTLQTAKHIMIDERVIKNRGIKTEFALDQYEGKNGYFLTEDGKFIFSKSSVTVEDQIRSIFISGELVPENELPAYGATLVTNVEVEESVSK
jgi:hypothetical protein